MTDLFNAGQRPAIDAGLSVSRVGGAAQTKAMKQVARSIKIDLASFEEMKSFSQFGSDLDASTVAILNHGEALLEVLKQTQYAPYPLEKEIFYLYAAKNKYLDELSRGKIRDYLAKAYEYAKSKNKKALDAISKEKEISDEVDNSLKATFEKFNELYLEEFK